ncbi:hypothetical protein DFJ73DRAFT_941315 [Zopfochytrium polystomum]|nr:hypothetical protein DFJ73DRAFT_941315 [Zopfochytrium polystomum]
MRRQEQSQHEQQCGIPRLLLLLLLGRRPSQPVLTLVAHAVAALSLLLLLLVLVARFGGQSSFLLAYRSASGYASLSEWPLGCSTAAQGGLIREGLGGGAGVESSWVWDSTTMRLDECDHYAHTGHLQGDLVWNTYKPFNYTAPSSSPPSPDDPQKTHNSGTTAEGSATTAACPPRNRATNHLAVIQSARNDSLPPYLRNKLVLSYGEDVDRMVVEAFCERVGGALTAVGLWEDGDDEDDDSHRQATAAAGTAPAAPAAPANLNRTAAEATPADALHACTCRDAHGNALPTNPPPPPAPAPFASPPPSPAPPAPTSPNSSSPTRPYPHPPPPRTLPPPRPSLLIAGTAFAALRAWARPRGTLALASLLARDPAAVPTFAATSFAPRLLAPLHLLATEAAPPAPPTPLVLRTTPLPWHGAAACPPLLVEKINEAVRAAAAFYSGRGGGDEGEEGEEQAGRPRVRALLDWDRLTRGMLTVLHENRCVQDVKGRLGFAQMVMSEMELLAWEEERRWRR